MIHLLVILLVLRSSYCLKCYIKAVNESEASIQDAPFDHWCKVAVVEPCDDTSFELSAKIPREIHRGNRATRYFCEEAPKLACFCSTELCNTDVSHFRRMWMNTKITTEGSACLKKVMNEAKIRETHVEPAEMIDDAPIEYQLKDSSSSNTKPTGPPVKPPAPSKKVPPTPRKPPSRKPEKPGVYEQVDPKQSQKQKKKGAAAVKKLNYVIFIVLGVVVVLLVVCIVLTYGNKKRKKKQQARRKSKEGDQRSAMSTDGRNSADQRSSLSNPPANQKNIMGNPAGDQKIASKQSVSKSAENVRPSGSRE